MADITGVVAAGPPKRGHHMGDYIPPEELEKFLATCNDVAAQKAAKEAAEKAKIQADNVGHRLLSKMGWKEGILSLSIYIMSLSRTSHSTMKMHSGRDTRTHQNR